METTRAKLQAARKYAGTSALADRTIEALEAMLDHANPTADRRHDATEIGFGSYRTNAHLEVA